MATPPKVALGKTITSTPLKPTSDYLSSDALIQNILQATQGGSKTADYFTQVNTIGELHAKLGRLGNDAWSKSTDENGLDVYYVAEVDEQGKAYYISISVQGMTIDKDGNICPCGSSAEINGTTYQTVGVVTHTIGYSNYTFSQTSRDIGLLAAGLIPLKVFGPYLSSLLKSAAHAVGNAISKLFSTPAQVGEALQQTEIELQGAGEEEIASGGVAVEEVAVEGAAIAAGTVFIGACVAVAVLFIALSFILHNSFHHVQIWNLTKYKMEWVYWFGTDLMGMKGQITHGPVEFKNGQAIPVPIPGANRRPLVPGTKGSPQVYYGELDVASSHEYNGIGYVLQLHLKDDLDQTIYAITVYYDIPFAGSNSTNLTFGEVTDLKKWYDDNAGNRSVSAQKTSSDDKITAKSSYDYLDGEHVVPSSKVGDSSNTAYYYQSMLCIVEKGLQVKDLPSV
ncbi:hypothetical protein DL767_007593 [Monosporascus sp. MG133]|nr:hypothetical protein DL767_007593 [Monosporascus sp. MG133]